MKLLLDVRTEEEYEQENIAGSLNIPHDEVTKRLAEIDKNREVLVYCRSGRRAAIVAELLLSKGFQAENIETIEAAKTALNN